MSEKSMSKDTRKNVILLHIAVMCFSCSGVIGQYVQVPAVQVAMGRVICSSLLLLAISLVCKDKLTLDSKKDYGLMILTGVVMAIHWSSFFQSIQTSSVAIGTITFSTFPLFLTFLEPLLFHEKIRGKNILNALILLMGVLITIPEFSVENKVTIESRMASGGFRRCCNNWFFMYGDCLFFICNGAERCKSADCGNHFRYGDGIRDRICTDLLKRNPYGQRTGRRCSDTWNRILFILA